jgi:hypothetical protein
VRQRGKPSPRVPAASGNPTSLASITGRVRPRLSAEEQPSIWNSLLLSPKEGPGRSMDQSLVRASGHRQTQSSSSWTSTPQIQGGLSMIQG